MSSIFACCVQCMFCTRLSRLVYVPSRCFFGLAVNVHVSEPYIRIGSITGRNRLILMSLWGLRVLCCPICYKQPMPFPCELSSPYRIPWCVNLGIIDPIDACARKRQQGVNGGCCWYEISLWLISYETYCCSCPTPVTGERFQHFLWILKWLQYRLQNQDQLSIELAFWRSI